MGSEMCIRDSRRQGGLTHTSPWRQINANGDQLTVHLDLRKCFTFLPHSSSSYRLHSHCGFTPSQVKFTSSSPNVPLYPCVGRSGEEEENQMRKLMVETPRGRPRFPFRGDARSVVELHRSFRNIVDYRLLLAGNW